MPTDSNDPASARRVGALPCSDVWGGNQDADTEVDSGSLLASIHASSCDGGKGGDIHFVGICKGCVLTRVAIADVVGHGRSVSAVGSYMYEALKAHLCDPDSSSILTEVNTIAHRKGLGAMTTAIVVAYDATRQEFHVSRAGHPSALIKRADDPCWSLPTAEPIAMAGRGPVGLPLAIQADAIYTEELVPARTGDRLFIYTDGVTEAMGPERELFGEDRLRRVLDGNADAPLPELKAAVLDSIRLHTGGRMTHDDVTLVAMEVGTCPS